MRSYRTLLLLALALACHKRPGGGGQAADTVAIDSTAVRPDSISDTVAIITTDTTDLPDSLIWPSDYHGHQAAALTSADVQALTQAAKGARRRLMAPARSGLPFGFSGYKPTSRWCSGFLNASNMTIAPQYLRSTLRAAEQCGYRFAPAIMRAMMTTNGQWNGPFSPTKAKAAGKAYSDALTEAEWARYAPIIPYIYGMDDMGCAPCWGGQTVSQQTIADVYAYLQTLTMAKYVPIALRVHPQWMLRNGMTKASWSMPDGSPRVDRTISQWYGIFQSYRPYPTQTQWYDWQRAAGANANVPAQSYTVAYGGCYKAADANGCPADKIQQYGAVANAYPGNCENIGWNYRGEFDREPWLSVIRGLAQDAANRSRPSACGNPGTP
jgi:hypothetical protein